MTYRRYALPAVAVALLAACGSDSADTTAPLTPALVGTFPASPSTDSMPAVSGNTEARARVRLYVDTSCAGAVYGSGIADGTGGFVAAVTRPVIGNDDTLFRASASDAAGTSPAALRRCCITR